MGRRASCKLQRAEKGAIRAAYRQLGGKLRYTLTHNGDGLESPLEVLYRAYAVCVLGGPIKNLHRLLPGGVSVGDVLTLLRCGGGCK